MKFKITIDVPSMMYLSYLGMEEEIERIRMLPEIRNFMFPQGEGTSRLYEMKFEYPVRFEVGFAWWRIWVYFASIILVVFILALTFF